MTGQPPLMEVATRTSRAPGFTDILWFDVVIRVGGVPVLTCRYATAGTDPQRPLAESARHAEREARATFGRRLAALLNPAPERPAPSPVPEPTG